MPQTEAIRAEIDTDLKAEAEHVLDELGLSASAAIELFYRQIVLRQGLPFEAEVPNAKTAQALHDAEGGVGLTRYSSVDEMIRSLTAGEDAHA